MSVVPASKHPLSAAIIKGFKAKESNIEKYLYLAALHSKDEELFYRVLIDEITEILPYVYTPVVGEVCQKFSHILRNSTRDRGLFVPYSARFHIPELLAEHAKKQPVVRCIVVTDGERILGLGDLGINGMGIPIGKLNLYTAMSGIPPHHCLPVTLDVGTNTKHYLEDPLYLGERHERIRGKEYFDFVGSFLEEADRRWKRPLIQFEDFGNSTAFKLLETHREKLCTFNDDIEGTASVALAGIKTALKVTGGKISSERFLFMGAGEAGVGIANLIVTAMRKEGLSEAEARKNCWLFDSRGLVVKSRTASLKHHKLPYAHEHEERTSFVECVRALKPSAIIGVAAIAGTFTKEVVEAMTAINARPIIFALSNPTSKAECTAAQAYEWSGEKALFASGSPFPEYVSPSTGARFVPRQGNNSYIFPGVGLGLVATASSRCIEEMFVAAAESLAEAVTKEDLAQGSLYPPLEKIREVSLGVAVTTAKIAIREGFAKGPSDEKSIEAMVRAAMWNPEPVKSSM